MTLTLNKVGSSDREESYKGTNHFVVLVFPVKGFLSSSCFPPTGTPLIFAAEHPFLPCTTFCNTAIISAEVSFDKILFNTCGWNVSIAFPLLSCISLTSIGFIKLPPLMIAAYALIICNGVTEMEVPNEIFAASRSEYQSLSGSMPDSCSQRCKGYLLPN